MKPMRLALLFVPALLSVGACSKPAAVGEDKAVAPALAAAPNAPAPASSAKANDAGKALNLPQLAYDYAYGFTASPDNIDHLLKADQAACDRAGVAECQMVSMGADADGDAGQFEHSLELRVTPAWLKTWQAGLGASLAAAHGHIREQKVTSEDLSLQIVDSEAHLKNKQALRDRLIEIIHSGSGKISELVDVESQLSQVQEDIDATQSALAVMHKRIDTVHLVLTYQSEAAVASNGTFAPVTAALRNSVGVFMQVVAMLITLICALLPVGILGLPLVWFVRKRAAARKDKVAMPG